MTSGSVTSSLSLLVVVSLFGVACSEDTLVDQTIATVVETEGVSSEVDIGSGVTSSPTSISGPTAATRTLTITLAFGGVLTAR